MWQEKEGDMGTAPEAPDTVQDAIPNESEGVERLGQNDRWEQHSSGGCHCLVAAEELQQRALADRQQATEPQPKASP